MNYVKEIADLYLVLNPGKTMLDGTDYTIIAEWEKEGIPLAIVLAALSEACLEPNAGNTAHDSLLYMNEMVVKKYYSWLQKSQTVAPASF